jgi:hypothetical protein
VDCSGETGGQLLRWSIKARRAKAWRRCLLPAPEQITPQAWLRETWKRVVGTLATGSFFKKPPEGTCYYGGTPLSIAAVLGHVDIVRLLLVEVGCR